MAKLVYTVSCKDLENVKEMVKIINNNIVEQGFISEYNNNLLNALLGKNWTKEYAIGKEVI